MAQMQHEPQKVGEYERPVTRKSSATGMIIGIIALLIALVVLALIFFR
jgi:hypothetical protein